MKIAGIDVSTKAIDLVLLDADTDHATWDRYQLDHGNADLIDRVRSVGGWWGYSTAMWDDVLAIGIERPAGKYGVAQVAMVFGAVLSRLPPLTLVKPWQPAQWRKTCGLPGNCTKELVTTWAVEKNWRACSTWPQDACDAYCIAYATRSVLVTDQQQLTAA